MHANHYTGNSKTFEMWAELLYRVFGFQAPTTMQGRVEGAYCISTETKLTISWYRTRNRKVFFHELLSIRALFIGALLIDRIWKIIQPDIDAHLSMIERCNCKHVQQ